MAKQSTPCSRRFSRTLIPAQNCLRLSIGYGNGVLGRSAVANRRDPQRDFAFQLAGGVLTIAVVSLGCLIVAVQALRWMGRW